MSRTEIQAFEGTGAEWNSVVAALPGAHLLQTWEWAHVKAAYGWNPMPFIWRMPADAEAMRSQGAGAPGKVAAAAMVLKRGILSRGFARRMCILYTPKGPLLDPSDIDLRTQVLQDLEDLGRREGAILVKIDPDVQLGQGYAGAEAHSDDPAGAAWLGMLKQRGWEFSNGQVQFRNSVWINLDTHATELLARMKQKTRYNIGLAERKGIAVRVGTADDLARLYHMYSETAHRDGFVIRDEAYYRTVWSTFLRGPGTADQPGAEALVADVAGEPIAALWLFHFARRSYYLYGMSSAAHRDKMPNYLLQWRAIQRSQELGCRIYDMWGAPDTLDEADPMWGVFRFKEGLGGNVIRTIGAWDYPSGGLWYGLYSKVVPRLLAVMRWRGHQRVRDVLNAA